MRRALKFSLDTTITGFVPCHTKFIREPEPDVIPPDHAMLLGVKDAKIRQLARRAPVMTSVQQ